MSETGSSFTEDQEARFIAERQADTAADELEDRRLSDASAATPADTPRASVSAPTTAAGGALAGATAGTVLFGPVGTVVGLLTGGAMGVAAAGGASAASDEPRATGPAEELGWDEHHDQGYRAHYEASPHRLADRPYDRMRGAYQLGHVLGAHPRYRGRSFDEVEPDIRGAWSDEATREHGSWDAVRHFARHGYEESRSRNRGESPIAENLGGGATHQRASFSDPLPTYTDPAYSSTGQDVPGDRTIPPNDDVRADHEVGRNDRP